MPIITVIGLSHWQQPCSIRLQLRVRARFFLLHEKVGWLCSGDRCQNINRTSYLYKWASSTYVWHFRCCKKMNTILKDTMFYNSNYWPQKILELMWMISLRTPITTISYTVFGRQTSEIHAVFCSCKYFNKETVQHGCCCKHIIGQLRRLLHRS